MNHAGGRQDGMAEIATMAVPCIARLQPCLERPPDVPTACDGPAWTVADMRWRIGCEAVTFDRWPKWDCGHLGSPCGQRNFFSRLRGASCSRFLRLTCGLRAETSSITCRRGSRSPSTRVILALVNWRRAGTRRYRDWTSEMGESVKECEFRGWHRPGVPLTMRFRACACDSRAPDSSKTVGQPCDSRAGKSCPRRGWTVPL